MTESRSKIAIVLLQFGGPDSLEAVEPFLLNLFSDPDIFELPFGAKFQTFVAQQISKRRAPSVREKYAEIGGKSPIVERTEEQVRALQQYFDAKHASLGVTVRLAGRYWKPFTADTMSALVHDGVQEVILLPLYAQYAVANAGSSFNEWDRELARQHAAFRERRVREYYKNEKYLEAINTRIEEGLAQFPNPKDVLLLFSAHGTPLDMVKRGDPYSAQIRETMELVMDMRGHDHEYLLSFQSKVGPKRWLKPSTHDMLIKLGARGVTDMLVIPIAFVSDHIETLHELDIEERKTAEASGITNYRVMKGLNAHPLFIECLADVALKEIEALRHE
ncbi:MAG: ferrochelatase [Bacteroidota bacterium]|nr:ferrochelatase [Bacteroidota bacterium]MDP4233742.1 ferrochelatase [Bacteroidota bacterium]MDP4242381.1 ferrochelatase [Bacteroidota bacterium]MDP4287503.1 ferrochelatase [Bacteroidota bacterium]